jgi:hypothetical protein
MDLRMMRPATIISIMTIRRRSPPVSNFVRQAEWSKQPWLRTVVVLATSGKGTCKKADTTYIRKAKHRQLDVNVVNPTLHRMHTAFTKDACLYLSGCHACVLVYVHTSSSVEYSRNPKVRVVSSGPVSVKCCHARLHVGRTKLKKNLQCLETFPARTRTIRFIIVTSDVLAGEWGMHACRPYNKRNDPVSTRRGLWQSRF